MKLRLRWSKDEEVDATASQFTQQAQTSGMQDAQRSPADNQQNKKKKRKRKKHYFVNKEIKMGDKNKLQKDMQTKTQPQQQPHPSQCVWWKYIYRKIWYHLPRWTKHYARIAKMNFPKKMAVRVPLNYSKHLRTHTHTHTKLFYFNLYSDHCFIESADWKNQYLENRFIIISRK